MRCKVSNSGIRGNEGESTDAFRPPRNASLECDTTALCVLRLRKLTLDVLNFDLLYMAIFIFQKGWLVGGCFLGDFCAALDTSA